MKRDPAAFQGVGRRPPYFEGWYFRLQSKEGRTVALIPGLSLSGRDPHSFVQVLDAVHGSFVKKYPVSAFEASDELLDVTVDASRFGRGFVCPEIPGPEGISGCVEFSGPVPFPRTRLLPGIEGPFAWLPVNECRHDVVLMRCALHGSLRLAGECINFDGGIGYVEKDWGCAFPLGYLWEQSTGLGEGTSFLLAAARVPMVGAAFTGVIGYLWDGTRLRRFSTYTGVRLVSVRQRDGALETELRGPGFYLHTRAEAGSGHPLEAPRPDGMSRVIKESVAVNLSVRLEDGRGRLLFGGTDPFAAAEYAPGGHSESSSADKPPFRA